MAEDFQGNLQNPDIPEQFQSDIPDEEIIEEIQASNEKEYLREIKKKNKGFLVEGLTLLERERIARWIISRYNEAKTKHQEICDKIDEYDETYRMVRKELPGSDGDMPNYVSPTTTVALETIHSNYMNVFFTPNDIGTVLPTEENDIQKVNKLSTFMGWSTKNELDIFEKCDRLFHNSSKVGEAPFILHWVKEYGTEIKREVVMNPNDPSQPLYDPDTQEPLFQEIEEQKLLYNGPKLEIFSRKDYIQPPNAMMDKDPEWEIRKLRMSFDDFLRDELQGKMYSGSIDEIKDWGGTAYSDTSKPDYDGDEIPIGKYNKEFLQCFMRMRITVIKTDKEGETEDKKELEDTFIAIVNVEDEVLCQLRKNKFPLKMSPIGLDYFLPDDEGRRSALGVCEMMKGIQTGYDAIWNQYIWGVTQSNNPFGFYTPMGNMQNEPLKIQNGFMFPTSDPNSINIVKIPPPDQSIHNMLELITGWAQLLFGISSYAAGVESQIDPSAPAKKAELVVAQGNVRMNTIIKRKNKTIKDILFRWFLLYKDNMPPNKFMRIAGDTKDNPWKFEAMLLSDFALKSLPDFELTGNIQNSNKAFVAQRAIAIYQLMVTNPFFNPATSQGMKALLQLSKWLLDKMDETGLSKFLPPMEGDQVNTPEEENARFLQGDSGEPVPGEDHVNHMKVHRNMLFDPNVPDEIKEKIIVPHIQSTVKMLQEEVTQQLVLSQTQGGANANQGGIAGQGQGQTQPPQGVVPGQPSNMGRPQGGNPDVPM